MPPPLHRTESLHSWWSDSNSLGPTISIHAAAKPLMKLLYHRQVTSFIEGNGFGPLSATTMELCCSYLGFKYISPKTKILILRELRMRIASKEEAHTAVDSLTPNRDLVAELLRSPNAQVRCDMCNVLGALASHDAAWGLKVLPECASSLLFDQNAEVQKSTLYFLAKVSERPDDAETVKAICQGVTTLGLDLNGPYLSLHAREILRNIAMHEVGLCLVEPGTAETSQAAIEAQRHALSKILTRGCVQEILGRLLLHDPHSIAQLSLRVRMRIYMRLVSHQDSEVDKCARSAIERVLPYLVTSDVLAVDSGEEAMAFWLWYQGQSQTKTLAWRGFWPGPDVF
ncbi:hypothetical protein C8R47DRAFT_1091011 [Mycena vitilis]|nr:hypothetical protein C8R47DRAFT_1091011 [Mycena vitilis]